MTVDQLRLILDGFYGDTEVKVLREGFFRRIKETIRNRFEPSKRCLYLLIGDDE